MFGHMLLECSRFKKEFNLGGIKICDSNMEKSNWTLFAFEPRSKSLWPSYLREAEEPFLGQTRFEGVVGCLM